LLPLQPSEILAKIPHNCKENINLKSLTPPSFLEPSKISLTDQIDWVHGSTGKRSILLAKKAYLLLPKTALSRNRQKTAHENQKLKL